MHMIEDEAFRACCFVRVRAAVTIILLKEVKSLLGSILLKVANTQEALKIAARKWTIRFFSRRIVNILGLVNSRLSSAQQYHLMEIVSRTIHQLLLAGELDMQLILGVIRLACPTQDTSELFLYLVEALTVLTTCKSWEESLALEKHEETCLDDVGPVLPCTGNQNADTCGAIQAKECEEALAQSGGSMEVLNNANGYRTLLSVSLDYSSLRNCAVHKMKSENSSLLQREVEEHQSSTAGSSTGTCMVTTEEKRRLFDQRVAQFLTCCCGISEPCIAAMPPPVRKAVAEALCGGSGPLVATLRAFRHTKGIVDVQPPLCCISLEPLRLQNGRVPPDVVAVAQRMGHQKKYHANLYKGCALYGWLIAARRPSSPQTRSLVLPTDVYRLT